MDASSARPLVGLLAAVLLAAACSNGGGGGDDQPAPGPDGTAATRAAAGVVVVAPEDGATVTSPVTVEVEVTGGEGAHLHVMIDTGCVGIDRQIPSDEQHIHLDEGATSTEVELEPGLRNLCVQLGDRSHVAFGTVDFISVTVEGDIPADEGSAPAGGGGVLSPAPGGGVVISPVPGGGSPAG